MIKKISRRSFLQACSVAAATAALTACGGGKAESKTADAHEAVTFMAPYKEIEAFIEQVHSVYPEVNIEVVPYSGDNTTTCLQNMFAAGDLPDVCTLTYYDPQIDLSPTNCWTFPATILRITMWSPVCRTCSTTVPSICCPRFTTATASPTTRPAAGTRLGAAQFFR